ncbi:hypothetical protein K440DRAFT_174410 [Wilcoxina mikolae CBS 423.85]|nr:hypothetical protein K440DRAFT_174410 [Wilcoxina mikolae CBS 423.85]
MRPTYTHTYHIHICLPTYYIPAYAHTFLHTPRRFCFTAYQAKRQHGFHSEDQPPSLLYTHGTLLAQHANRRYLIDCPCRLALLTGAKYTAQLPFSAPRSFRRLAVRVIRREALSRDLQVRRSWPVARHRHSPPMATEDPIPPPTRPSAIQFRELVLRRILVRPHLDYHLHQRRHHRRPGVQRLDLLQEAAARPNSAGIAL